MIFMLAFIKLTANDSTTVRVDRLTTDGAAVVASQEYEDSGNLTGLRGPADGRSKLLDGVVVHGCGDQWRPNGTRCDGVDTDASGNVLV